MKRHNVILESSIEPKDKNVLWLHGKKLKKFGKTGWEDIGNEALALGAFHGYFPDSASLPTDVTTPGYAYVGLNNPYEIWKFNGELWSDSGTHIDVNDVDEEDITRNTDGKLQFKNRAYGDGMGYVILRKDKTIAEQVTQANTIYEIRYDFEIDTNFIMPENSRFCFIGGKAKIGNSVVISSNEVRASEIGMVQNSVSFAVKNAVLLAYYTNLGMHIIIDGVYYIDSDDSPIILTNDVVWSGNGILIKTNPLNTLFSINVPIKIYLNGLTFDGNYDVSNTTRSKIFNVDSILYSKGVYIKNCIIKKVRIYSHYGHDVDQQSILDGDYEVIFENNIISDISNSVCFITNCKCTLLKITNNIFRKIHNYIFEAAVDNSYQNLSFSRLTTAIIDNNHWDNSELIIENTTSAYNCMIILESDICIFTNNYIKDFIILNGDKGYVTYTAYLSARVCEIVNNTFINVVGFNNPEYTDIFKCKMHNDDIELSERKIENNTYILTKECVDKYGDINNPPNKTFTTFQSNIDRISISNNLIDAYCEFALGGGAELEYKNYEFRNNKIVCHSLANKNNTLLRFKDSSNTANIIIENNEVLPDIFSKEQVCLLYSNIPNEYSIYFKNNNFEGYGLGYSLESSLNVKEFSGKLSILPWAENMNLTRHYSAQKEDIIFDKPFGDTPSMLFLYSIKDSKFLFESKISEIYLMNTKTQYEDSSFLGTEIINIKHSNHCVTVIIHFKSDVVEIYDGQGNLKSFNRTISHNNVSISIKDKYESIMAVLLVRYNNSWLLDFYPASIKNNMNISIKTIDNQYVFPNLENEYLGTTLKNVDSMSQASKGIPMIYSGKLVFFDGNKARTAGGHSVAENKGTTSQRPTNLDNTNDVGYIYFDSTLGKPIYWTGVKWVDATGADV